MVIVDVYKGKWLKYEPFHIYSSGISSIAMMWPIRIPVSLANNVCKEYPWSVSNLINSKLNEIRVSWPKVFATFTTSIFFSVAGRRYSDSFANHVSDHRVELSNYKLCKKAIASVLHCSLNFLYRDNNNKQKTIKKIEQIMAVVSFYIYKSRIWFVFIYEKCFYLRI